MPSRLNPYINFKDNTRQAMEFYKTVFGGTLTISTFKEGGMSQGPADENLIMHSMLEAPNGMTLMASDTPPGWDFKPGTNMSISLSGDEDALLRGFWQKLSAKGTTTMPLETAPWGDTFGMCTDQFGIQWLVNIAGKTA
jgi:PhnB protein